MTNEQTSVYIMGLGWLGLPLAQSLRRKNMQVGGSVSTVSKQKLVEPFIHAQHFDMYSHEPTSLQRDCFTNASMVLNIPPGRKSFDSKRFISAMTSLIDYAMACELRQLIFISTTSVFNACEGSVSNICVPKPTTPSGHAHLVIEQHLFEHYKQRSCIVRPSGLVGPKVNINGETVGFRHPIYSLSSKTDIANGSSPINLVHQDDLVAIIEQIIQRKVCARSFNVAAMEHPTKAEYYKWCAHQLKLQQPGFLAHQTADNKKRQLAKTIDAFESFTALGLRPIHASPYTMLPNSQNG